MNNTIIGIDSGKDLTPEDRKATEQHEKVSEDNAREHHTEKMKIIDEIQVETPVPDSQSDSDQNEFYQSFYDMLEKEHARCHASDATGMSAKETKRQKKMLKEQEKERARQQKEREEQEKERARQADQKKRAGEDMMELVDHLESTTNDSDSKSSRLPSSRMHAIYQSKELPALELVRKIKMASSQWAAYRCEARRIACTMTGNRVLPLLSRYLKRIVCSHRREYQEKFRKNAAELLNDLSIVLSWHINDEGAGTEQEKVVLEQLR